MLFQQYKGLKSSKECCHTSEDLPQLYSPPVRKKNPQVINKRYSWTHRVSSLREPANSTGRQEICLGHLLYQSYSFVLAWIPDVPLEWFSRTSGFLVSQKILQLPQQKDNPLVTIKSLQVMRPGFESQLCSSFLYDSQSHLRFVLRLPTCKVVLPYTRNGFYKKHVIFVWDKEVLIVFTYGRGLYCARHCKLLIILYSPYSSSMASHYSHKSGGSKLTWGLLPF